MAKLESLAARVRCRSCGGPVELIRAPLAGVPQYKFRCTLCPWESLPQRRVQLERHDRLIRRAYQIAARHRSEPKQLALL